MSRFVNFDTHRIELGKSEHGPEYVDLRNDLSALERDHLYGSMMIANISEDAETSRVLRSDNYRMAILSTYLTGWQLFDPAGQLVPYSKEALLRLDEETVSLVVRHIDAFQKGRAEEKKALSGPSEPLPTSISVNDSDGRGENSRTPPPA